MNDKTVPTVRITLHPFGREDFSRLISWLPTEADLIEWCDRNFLWYSVGLPLVSLVRTGHRWSSWHSPKLIKPGRMRRSVCLRRCVALEAPSELDAVNS